ncbi:MAG TPA: hypothetical protein VKR23_16030 [Gaiellaceae bacterium]|nr:hypothetical protein [Gaiellaceae bacterium]
MRLFLGVDPGVSGGIAILNPTGGVQDVCRMPASDEDLCDTLAAYGGRESTAVLERVSASPQMGVVSAFTFGVGFGRLRLGLRAAAIPFELVHPLVWQKAMKCRTHGDKNISRDRAQCLFPKLYVTHAIGDALLLAEYGRRLALHVPMPADQPLFEVAR